VRLLIAAACGLLLAGTAFAQDKPAVVSSTADKLEAAGVHAVIGVTVEPAPVQPAAGAPVAVDDRVVVSPDDPPPPAKKAGKKARK
jgi:hypothetical protein